jgi:hypothetical protein
MQAHIEALYTHSIEQRLIRVNEPQGGPAARLFLGRTADGNVWRLGEGVSQPLVEQLQALCADEPPLTELQAKPRHFHTYLKLLHTPEQPERYSMGPAYLVPEHEGAPADLVLVTSSNAQPLCSELTQLVSWLDARQPCFAIVEQERAVAICCSVRVTPTAHEAGVDTLPAYRGRGYAREVVLAWAAAVRQLGCLPLYSTWWGNASSLAVARKAELILIGVDFSVQ